MISGQTICKKKKKKKEKKTFKKQNVCRNEKRKNHQYYKNCNKVEYKIKKMFIQTVF